MAQISRDYPIVQAITAETSDLAFVQTALSPLNIPELLCMIIHNLAPKDQPSAARVCREWSELALDQIWHTIKSFVPLLRLVGPMRQRPNDVWEFQEDIQSADWSRYAFYAPRIRVITLSLYYYSTVSKQAFQAFVDHIPSHFGLPRPSSIQLSMISGYNAMPLVSQSLPLISQSLQKLRVGNWLPHEMTYPQDHAVAMQVMVSAVAMLDEPCLERLEVQSSFRDAGLLEAFDRCLAKHWSKISTLTARLPFECQTWDSIFGLSALRTLDIAPLQPAFPDAGLSEDIVPIIRTLVAEQPLLKTFQLDLPLPREQDLDNSLYSQLIHELMGLRNLENLALYVIGSLSLFESDVREMRASWPKIRNLQFHCYSRGPSGMHRREITIQNDLSLLPSFLRYLPSLEELHIQFTCNPTLTAPQERLPAPGFRILNLVASPSPEESHKGVAAYLAAVLPRSAVVQYTGEPDKTRIWQSIIEALESQRAESEPTGAEVDT